MAAVFAQSTSYIVSTQYGMQSSMTSGVRPLQYNPLFLITRPSPLETYASQTSYLIIHVCGTRSQTILEVYENYVCAVYCTHILGSLLTFGTSMVYTCSAFSVLSKTMVFLSATVVQEGWFYTRLTQMQCRKCCNNCFYVYKLLI